MSCAKAGPNVMTLRTTDPLRFRVVSVEDGMMLRQLLSIRLKVPPAAAAELVRAGGVYVGPLRMCMPTLRVGAGERVTVYRRAAEVDALPVTALRVCYRDDLCTIIDKPHGVPAVATRASIRGTISQALVQLLESERVVRPYVGLVTPLPSAGAGLALYTIRSQADASAYTQFATLPVHRELRVRLRGEMTTAQQVCEAALERSPAGTWRLARGDAANAVAARTEFRRLAVTSGETIAAVSLTEGTWESVVLHAAVLGLPVVGDGVEAAELGLVVAQMAFTHPVTGAAVTAKAVLPTWAEVPGEPGELGEPVGA